ncbi:hypothetical protein [Sphingobacterium kyonggiense]
METLFRKVLVSERHVGERKLCFTKTNDEVYGVIYLNNSTLEWYCEDEGYKWVYDEYPIITHTQEEIQPPSEDEVIMFLNKKYCGHASVVTIKDTYNYILGFINNKK